VLAAVLVGLEAVLAQFFAGGFAAIRGGYERHSAVFGRTLRVGGDRGGGGRVR
jgi:biotin-(acetyl-CoA carboxylase) ligase